MMAGDLSELTKTRIGNAIANGDIENVKICLKEKENLRWRDKRGNTYIHLLAAVYQPNIFHILISAGVDINIQNKHGNTPLHNSALAGISFNVPLLMMAGANTTLRNKDGKLACDLPTKNGTWKKLYELYQPGLFECVDNHDVHNFKQLLHKWCRYDASRDGRTLRQHAASKQFHDIVGIIDSHQYTLNCIYGVLEHDVKKVKEALKKTSCKVNYLNEGHGKKHILQYAIDMNRHDIVSLLCTNGANVNIPISIRHFFRGPLYYEAFPLKGENISPAITECILESGADPKAKDEKGRTALHYLVDRCDEESNLNFIQYFLAKGVDIAARDDTGATARNIARLTGQTSVVTAIDKRLIELIRGTKLDTLWKLFVEGYEDFFIEYQWRDSYIYAAGNETEEVSSFLKGLPDVQNDVKRIQSLITGGDKEERVIELLNNHQNAELLMKFKDRAGRCLLTLAILHGCNTSFMEMLLEKCDSVVNSKDNMNRTPLHYAYSLGEGGKDLLTILKSYNADELAEDVMGKIPSDYADDIDFIPQEKLKVYGLQWEMIILTKYEALKKIIVSPKKSPHRKYILFLRGIKNMLYPFSSFPKVLEPYSVPLRMNFRDLVFLALEHNQPDIVKKLVYLGSDCKRKEKIAVEEDTFKWMNSEEYAAHLGYTDLVQYIRENTVSSDRISLKVVKERVTRFLVGKKLQ
ncbi:uncharacterized protein LOC141915168 [Tubulanus polymorphus]|uniref:uncharacterized protein LOC141915168 n=1 Tax=Tubulanus polymorphus TaxID=672921 RepID=UPI003DA5C2AC